MIATGLIALTSWAQPIATLEVEIEGTGYTVDTADFTKIARTPALTPTAAPPPNFFSYVSIWDVVRVNGRPARGTNVIQGFYVRMSPSPTPGVAISDTTRNNFAISQLEIQDADGREHRDDLVPRLLRRKRTSGSSGHVVLEFDRGWRNRRILRSQRPDRPFSRSAQAGGADASVDRGGSVHAPRPGKPSRLHVYHSAHPPVRASDREGVPHGLPTGFCLQPGSARGDTHRASERTRARGRSQVWRSGARNPVPDLRSGGSVVWGTNSPSCEQGRLARDSGYVSG